MRVLLVAASSVFLLAACGNGAGSTLGATGSSSGQPAIRDLSGIEISSKEPIATPMSDTRVYDVDQLPVMESLGDYYGYIGPLYSQLQLNTGISVLSRTISVADSGHWAATLMVRNDTLMTVGHVHTTAQLLDNAGNVLASVSATSPVVDARPGEPVPIVLSSDVAAADVAKVRYSTNAGADVAVQRRIEMMSLRTLPFGERPPVKIPGEYADEGSPPYPYINLISAVNRADQQVSSYTVVVGWMSHDGQLRHVQTARTVEIGQTLEQKSYGMDNIVVVSDKSEASSLADLTPVMWAVAQ